MCAVVGVLSEGPVNQDLFDALTMLQHRGQDSAGLATCDETSKIHMHKRNGLVREVVRTSDMMILKGRVGIGHVRYPTAGTLSAEEAQPFFVNSPYGLCLVHNGNLINAPQLKLALFEEDRRHLNTDSDSEVLLNVLAHELALVGPKDAKDLTPAQIFQAVTRVHARCQGAYAVVALIVGHGLLAFRDPNGIRPLVWGQRERAGCAADVAVASESVALSALGFSLESDLAPGEALFIDLKRTVHRAQCAEKSELVPCIFEYVYLARPDSVIDGVPVYQSRLNMGEALARRIRALGLDHDIDVVIPIPDTSRTAAVPMARQLGVPYREGFVKNRYIGRTFIMPGQQVRKKSVRQKLNPIESEFRGKNVLLVDDSIVRGTTSQAVIQMVRNAGAKRVFLASVSPEIRYPNVYGIDMPSAKDFIAHERSTAEIAEEIGADWVIFQTLEDLEASVCQENPKLKEFEDSIFTGEYVTGGIDAAYLERISTRGGT